jgi:hypothetical protein
MNRGQCPGGRLPPGVQEDATGVECPGDLWLHAGDRGMTGRHRTGLLAGPNSGGVEAAA